MKLVVSERNRGYSFEIRYDCDDIDHVDRDRAFRICGGYSKAIYEGFNPDHEIFRIYFNNGEQATFDLDMVDINFERDD